MFATNALKIWNILCWKFHDEKKKIDVKKVSFVFYPSRTVVDGGMEIKGSERESKHLNPIWIIKDSHSIPHYHDYMQIGRTNL